VILIVVSIVAIVLSYGTATGPALVSIGAVQQSMGAVLLASALTVARIAISGALIGGLMGGLHAMAYGGDLWDSIVEGALWGAALNLVFYAVARIANAVAAKVAAANAKPKAATGYHATRPEYAKSIKENGFRESPGGRAGGGGVYVNNTKEGAIAEYWHYNQGGPKPVVLKVRYNSGNQVPFKNLGPHIQGSILPGADTIIFESLRKPGTYNILVKNGSIIILK